jgi:hypothetical protein
VGITAYQAIIIEVPVPFGEIGDLVWLDANQNGIQDSGERGLGGVTLKLFKDGAEVASKVSSANGFYLFEGLRPANYTVEYVTPNGYLTSPTLQGGDRALDSNLNKGPEVNLPAGGSDRTFDFGFYELQCAGSIGDFVWFDLDGDGIQDANEPGLGGRRFAQWHSEHPHGRIRLLPLRRAVSGDVPGFGHHALRLQDDHPKRAGQHEGGRQRRSVGHDIPCRHGCDDRLRVQEVHGSAPSGRLLHVYAGRLGRETGR